jgi:hypothetical protein
VLENISSCSASAAMVKGARRSLSKKNHNA